MMPIVLAQGQYFIYYSQVLPRACAMGSELTEKPSGTLQNVLFPWAMYPTHIHSYPRGAPRPGPCNRWERRPGEAAAHQRSLGDTQAHLKFRE